MKSVPSPITISPAIFEVYELYRLFLHYFAVIRNTSTIGVKCSIYGAPGFVSGGGGRTGSRMPIPGSSCPDAGYRISARLTFSNSLLQPVHLSDPKCNRLCRLFLRRRPTNGIIVHSICCWTICCREYPAFYFVSSTTKVLTDFSQFQEVSRADFRYVVLPFPA